MTSSPLDRLVDEWLSRVERAAADLPPEQRGELLADLREHIAVARADLSPETEAGVRTILEHLGDPAMIAAEARQGEPAPHGDAPPISPATDPPVRRRTGLWIGIAVGAVVLVCAGCLAAGLGMFAWSGITMTDGVVVPAPPASPTWAPAPR